jgi:hypothetical protein
MKTLEDEAFDDLAKKQGGGFPAKRKAAADKLQEPVYNITVFDNAHPKGIPLEDWVQPAQEPVADDKTIALVKQCRDAFAEELAAYDIQPPIHHLKQGYADCVAWLAAHNIGATK